MIQKNQKPIQFQFAAFNDILDTIVVARGVEALSWERVGRGYDLILN
jgi:hypothetical protein